LIGDTGIFGWTDCSIAKGRYRQFKSRAVDDFVAVKALNFNRTQ